MKQQLFLRTLSILFFFVMVSCSSPNKGSNNKETPNSKPTSEKSYKIINIEPDEAFSQATINVRLTTEISKTELNKIAFQLKADYRKYSKLWIFYFLPDMSTENGAWAISHFKPSLELDIIGTSQSSLEEMKKTKVNGDVLSSWIDNDPISPNKLYLTKIDGKLLMKTIYAKTKYGDAFEIEEQLIEKTFNGLIRYDGDNDHGEYYVIEKNGNLGLYNRDGKFNEAKKE